MFVVLPKMILCLCDTVDDMASLGQCILVFEQIVASGTIVAIKVR